ncbi:chorismate-binding protein [Streptomyces mexicanus]|uniref:chorismate-binding protein n=1 Tax=Streptomyces mexicanus TaxID=178566 RepID=UPI003669E67B
MTNATPGLGRAQPGTNPDRITTPFPLPAGGTEAILNVVSAAGYDPVAVYERLDPQTRQPVRTHIGLTVKSTVVPVAPQIDGFDRLRSVLEASAEPVLGFLSFEAGVAVSSTKPAAVTAPAAVFMELVDYFVVDHRQRSGTLVTTSVSGDGARGMIEMFASEVPETAGIGRQEVRDEDWEALVTEEQFNAGVDRIKMAATGTATPAGAVLSVPLRRRGPVNEIESYRALRKMNPSTCMFLLRVEGFSLWGATSLSMVEVRERHLVAETDGATHAVPDGAGAEFVWAPSDKELHEYEVVVAALREDLEAISATGTLRFTREREIREFFRLRHIFAEAQAELADGVDAIDALRKLFPHGAATGHPRTDALPLIEAGETLARGPFAGAIGMFGVDGSVDAACVSRSAWNTSEGTVVHAGAKIVAESDSGAEYRECVLKTAALRQSLRAGIPDENRTGA